METNTDPTACTRCGAHPGTEFLWGGNGCTACVKKSPSEYEKAAGDHPLVMAEGGANDIDRCHRVINRLEAEVERLRLDNERLINSLLVVRRATVEVVDKTVAAEAAKG